MISKFSQGAININIIDLFDLNHMIYILHIFEKRIYRKRENNFLNDIS